MGKLGPILLIMATAGACGGDDSPTDPDASRADAILTPDAAVDAAPDAPPPPQSEGIVLVAEQESAGGAAGAVGVTFSPGHLFGTPVGSAGGCEVFIGAVDDGLSAGAITVTGTIESVSMVPDGPTPPVSYESVGGIPANLFEEGATIDITADGEVGGVPGFSGSVIAPAALANVSIPESISRANPNIVIWTAGSGEEMWLWVLALGTSPTPDLIWCRMDDTGSFTIPSAALALLPAADTQGIVSLWRTTTTWVTAGDTEVALSAATAFQSQLLAIEP